MLRAPGRRRGRCARLHLRQPCRHREGGGDRHTLAHELTHVSQQRQGPVAGP
ncbi:MULTISPECIES: DUF4157 domain-containing protein [unclassified Streptomyces]|uniref:eCIS core domain-containing protein n=1 Tax=unclassified Streptomyces TaxID=2593676 RepID=UPI00382B049E